LLQEAQTRKVTLCDTWQLFPETTVPELEATKTRQAESRGVPCQQSKCAKSAARRAATRENRMRLHLNRGP
jgi:hypothetical protein